MARILLLFLFLSTETLAQEWVDYYHDGTLIISMPYYHYERKADGLLVSTANIEGAVIVVTHMRENLTMRFNIRDTADLKAAYYTVRDELIKTHKGKLLKSDIIKKQGLKWIHYVDSGSVHGVDQVIHNILLFVNDRMYTMTYFEMGPGTPEKDEARKKIFSSARLAPGIAKNQVSSVIYNQPLPKGFLVPVLLTTGGIGACIALIYLIQLGRKRINSRKSPAGQ